MIEINYLGRIGNNFFQYVFARLLSLKSGLYLKTKFPHQDLVRTTEHRLGIRINEPLCIINDFIGATADAFFEKRIIKGKKQKKHYILNGYFQNPDYYNPFVDVIKRFFLLEPVERNIKDIVMSLRLGEMSYYNNIIHPQWYLDILEKESFENLHIVGAQIDEPYLEYFKKYNPIVVPNDHYKDFHYIRKFETVICSNSTYAWWACFLGEARKIYMFKRWTISEAIERRMFWLSTRLSKMCNSVIVDGEFIDGFKSKTFYNKDSHKLPKHLRLL